MATLDVPSEKKQESKEEKESSTQIDEDVEKQMRAAPKIATPMYIKAYEWMQSDMVTITFEDEYHQIYARSLIGKNTLREVKTQLDEMFPATP